MELIFLPEEKTPWHGPGLEPTTARSEVQRANHYTTAPPLAKSSMTPNESHRAITLLWHNMITIFVFYS